MIFQWYKIDFGGSDQALLDFLRKNGTEDFQSKVKAFDEACGTAKPKIVWDKYNWGLNTK